MQVAAFHTIYKTLRKRDSGYQERKKHSSLEKDFCEAIVVTSDDRMENADPALIEQWLRNYSKQWLRNYSKKNKDLLLTAEGREVTL